MRTPFSTSALIAIALAVDADAEPLTPSRGRGLPVWEWSIPAGSGTSLRIDLVRADVTIAASHDGSISVRIEAAGSPEDAARIWIDVSHRDSVYVVSDRFPRRSPWVFGRECLPPPDERGDFWLVSTRLKVVVAVPPGMRPTIYIKERSR